MAENSPSQSINPEEAQANSLSEDDIYSPRNDSNHQSSVTKATGNKLVLGGIAAAIIAIMSVGGVSFASAFSSSSVPPNENSCMQHYKDYHFKNSGQCIDWWNQHHSGYGYGGQPPVTPPPSHHFHFPHFGFGFITHFFDNSGHGKKH